MAACFSSSSSPCTKADWAACGYAFVGDAPFAVLSVLWLGYGLVHLLRVGSVGSFLHFDVDGIHDPVAQGSTAALLHCFHIVICRHCDCAGAAQVGLPSTRSAAAVLEAARHVGRVAIVHVHAARDWAQSHGCPRSREPQPLYLQRLQRGGATFLILGLTTMRCRYSTSSRQSSAAAFFCSSGTGDALSVQHHFLVRFLNLT